MRRRCPKCGGTIWRIGNAYYCNNCKARFTGSEVTVPPTKGDCIRAKTNEELAEWIDTVQDDAMCYGMHDAESYYPIGTRNWLAWLEQEEEK